MSTQDSFREVLKSWLEDNIASEDANGEWHGDDTNVGDILADERLKPLTDFLATTERQLLERVEKFVKNQIQDAKKNTNVGDAVKFINQSGYRSNHDSVKVLYLGHYQALDDVLTFLSSLTKDKDNPN